MAGLCKTVSWSLTWVFCSLRDYLTKFMIIVLVSSCVPVDLQCTYYKQKFLHMVVDLTVHLPHTIQWVLLWIQIFANKELAWEVMHAILCLQMIYLKCQKRNISKCYLGPHTQNCFMVLHFVTSHHWTVLVANNCWQLFLMVVMLEYVDYTMW